MIYTILTWTSCVLLILGSGSAALCLFALADSRR
jgi:hypothetical protein